MAGAGDVTAARLHYLQNFAGLSANVIRLALDQDVMRVDRAVEENLLAELFFNSRLAFSQNSTETPHHPGTRSGS